MMVAVGLPVIAGPGDLRQQISDRLAELKKRLHEQTHTAPLADAIEIGRTQGNIGALSWVLRQLESAQ